MIALRFAPKHKCLHYSLKHTFMPIRVALKFTLKKGTQLTVQTLSMTLEMKYANITRICSTVFA